MTNIKTKLWKLLHFPHFWHEESKQPIRCHKSSPISEGTLQPLIPEKILPCSSLPMANAFFYIVAPFFPICFERHVVVFRNLSLPVEKILIIHVAKEPAAIMPMTMYQDHMMCITSCHIKCLLWPDLGYYLNSYSMNPLFHRINIL